jgi:modulator of FtsH protease HflK
MPRFLKLFLVALSLWLLTGVYIVGGNERGVVRRFGRVVTSSEGKMLLKPNGLHFDWPWPISRVNRVNLNEVRTLNVPIKPQNPEAEALLLGEDSQPEPDFLTGDKNLLQVRLTVHYRLADSRVGDFLFGSVSITETLACLAETVTAEALAQSGVDFVQISGLSELRRELTRRLQQQADRQRLGLMIEEVTLDEISPPVQVKADFLDVANARADREQIIQAALSSAEQRRRSAEAEAREIRDAAHSQAQEILQAANGSAGRFSRIIAEFQSPDSTKFDSQALARRLALEQYYFQTVTEILGRVKGKVFLDTGQPVDLSFWRSLNPDKPPSKTPPKETE